VKFKHRIELMWTPEVNLRIEVDPTIPMRGTRRLDDALLEAMAAFDEIQAKKARHRETRKRSSPS
jgi:hypothetical protein